MSDQALRQPRRPNGVHGHVQVKTAEHVYIISGYSEPEHDVHQYVPLQFVWRYKLISQKWRLMTCFGAPALLNMRLCGATGEIVDNKLYMFFGFDEEHGDINGVYQLNLTTWSWQEVFTNGTKPRYCIFKLYSLNQIGLFLDGASVRSCGVAPVLFCSPYKGAFCNLLGYCLLSKEILEAHNWHCS